jgi:hypothetical protein
LVTVLTRSTGIPAAASGATSGVHARFLAKLATGRQVRFGLFYQWVHHDITENC